uniref:Uncharacterized protein n=1 Tax=Arundo donax TaxID=35708 RepID=A0A0A9A2U8_ARUDO
MATLLLLYLARSSQQQAMHFHACNVLDAKTRCCI